MDDNLKKLVDNYQPNSDILAKLSRVKVLAAVGPASSGKTSIIKEAVKISNDVMLIGNETTRKPGSKELVDSSEFTFRTRQEVINDIQIALLVQIVVGVNGDLYCTRLQSYPRGKVGLMAVISSVIEQFRSLPFEYFKTAFIVPFYDEWLERFEAQANDRSWSPQERSKRLVEAKRSYEFSLNDQQMHFVLNDTIPKATGRFLQITGNQPPDDELKAKTIAQNNYNKLLKLLA